MVHRLALFIGVVGAAGVLALAMFLGSLPGTDATAVVTSATNPPAARRPVKTVFDNVYVEPTPKPQAARPDRAPNTVATSREPREPREGRERGDRREGRRERSSGGDD